MKRMLVALAALVLALSIISCAAAPAQYSKAPSGVALPPMPPAAATAAPAMPPSLDSQRGYAPNGTGSSIPNAATAERMIVYTAQLGIQVKDADKAASDITAIVARYNGYVAGANMARDSKGVMSGTLTLRVPAESLDAAQKDIEAAGIKVLNRNRTTNDVTDQYTDLNARLTNLQAAETELRDLLTTTREKTGKADDILAVYNQLTQVRGQIEQIKGQMNVLSKTSTYATLTVSLVPETQVQVVEPEGWLPDRIAREALRSLVQALQGLATLGIWAFLFFAPLLVVVILPFAIVILIARAIIRRRGRKQLPAT